MYAIVGDSKKMKPLILSFPKSGLNMLSILLEHYTNRKTPDTNSKKDGTSKYNYGATNLDLAFTRSHNISKFGITPSYLQYDTTNISKLVLILRDYKYAYLVGDVKNKVFGMNLNDYIDNIKFYSKCNLPKMVIYYEDLILSIKPHLELYEFLGLPHTYSGELWQDVNKYATDVFLKNKPDYTKVNNTPSTYDSNLMQNSLDMLKSNLNRDELGLLNRYIE